MFEYQYDDFRNTPGQEDTRSSKAHFEMLISKVLKATVDRKKITIISQSSDDNIADGAMIDSSSRKDPLLMTTVQSFVTCIENNTSLATSAYLSTVLGCNVNKFCNTEDKAIGSVFSELTTVTEPDVQAKLRKHWLSNVESHSNSWVLDTHDNNFNAPLFKFADRNGLDQPLTNTGKPDFTSLIAPMFIEIKDVKTSPGRSIANGATMKNHEYEVLDQAVNRVRVTAFQNELLKRIFCFASTGSRSWLVFCERDFSLETVNPTDEERPLLTETYRIIPIKTEQILTIWKSISRAASQDKGYYMHSDAFFIASILKCMKFDLAYSMIHIIGNSGSNGSMVYGISPNEPFYAESTGHTVMRFLPKATFAIKVPQRQDRGDNEVKILRVLKGCQSVAKYVVGIFSCSTKNDSPIEVPKFEDFLEARLGPLNAHSTAVSSSALSPGLKHFQPPLQSPVNKDPTKSKFSIESLQSGDSTACMNVRLAGGDTMDPSDVWWNFGASKRQGSSASGDNKKRTRATNSANSELTQKSRKRTAVLMHIACDRVPFTLESKKCLRDQLDELHKCRVLHTDMRFSNIVPFAIDTGSDGALAVREYIIDFDLAVQMGSNDRVEIDISHPGARRDLALTMSILPPDSQVKSVEWSAGKDLEALFNCESDLKTAPTKGNKKKEMSSSFKACFEKIAKANSAKSEEDQEESGNDSCQTNRKRKRGNGKGSK